MTRTEAIRYLNRCADHNGTHWYGGSEYPADECPTCRGTNDVGHLDTLGSRYGSTSAKCALVAYRMAYLQARDAGDHVDESYLDGAMSLVVNDQDAPEYIIRNYGSHPERYVSQTRQK